MWVAECNSLANDLSLLYVLSSAVLAFAFAFASKLLVWQADAVIGSVAHRDSSGHDQSDRGKVEDDLRSMAFEPQCHPPPPEISGNSPFS